MVAKGQGKGENSAHWLHKGHQKTPVSEGTSLHLDYGSSYTIVYHTKFIKLYAKYERTLLWINVLTLKTLYTFKSLMMKQFIQSQFYSQLQSSKIPWNAVNFQGARLKTTYHSPTLRIVYKFKFIIRLGHQVLYILNGIV